ncbi:hypothetical protein PFICI_07633 [Pestalotiopsis fici W106-1]|uniref:Uncharacterized protein n=1 Tax=Pestalotiopsis fici (strain W106-1 / CGMCC3.15140) TaxID=1229662 RepID=W3X257_PESFW|nr:uncharacterized protein PFICI_07633 [Pestalotiopsis fici W106-1]ETS80104.1 hypothetical protein PFICI_07633 [Pestalotiopsis fici W106-1]
MKTQHYESVQHEEPPSLSVDSSSTRRDVPAPISPDLKWRPSYLRRRVMGGFCFTFAMVVLALELLLVASHKDNGIATGHYSQHYAWTYGPTAFFTIIAAAFSRVEYQSKLMAPWIRMAKQPTQVDRSLLLDYISQLQLWTIYTSLANRDFVVAASTIVSLLIKLLIVLSTGLITLSAMQIKTDSLPVVVQSQFLDNNTQLLDTNSLPYYVMEYSLAGNLTYPSGMSKEFAFQSVKSDAGQIQITVEGLTNSLTCEPANLTVENAGFFMVGRDWGRTTLNITIRSPSCVMNVEFQGPSPPMANGTGPPRFFGRFLHGQCDGTSDDSGKRVVVLLGHMTDMDLDSSTQVLCSPSYKIIHVDLVQNASHIESVTPSSGDWSRTLSHVSAWSIMQGHLNAYQNQIVFGESDPYVEVGQLQISVDTYTESIYRSQLDPSVTVSLLSDTNMLEKIASDYYQQFGAIIARTSLMETTPMDAFAKGIINENRLVVQDWAVHWMAGLAATSFVLVFVIMLTIPGHGVLPCNPSTFPGMAAIMSHSDHLSTTLQGHGDADKKALHRALQRMNFQSEATKTTETDRPQFAILDTSTPTTDDNSKVQQSISVHPYPWALHHASRLALCLTLVAIIIALELVLKKSNHGRGLGDVSDEIYMHYLWTLLPGLLFGTISMVFSSIDSTVRAVVPYTMLRNLVRTDVFMVLDFLDMSVPHAIYHESRLRHLGALATTATVLVASFFTIISASLYQAISIQSESPTTLRATDSFPHMLVESQWDKTNDTSFKNGVQTASMILVGNQSYPKFTYEGLAFPHYVPETQTAGSEVSNLSTLLFNAVVPAIQQSLVCRQYDSAQMNSTRQLINSVDYFSINITDEICDLNFFEPDRGFVNILSNMSYFGVGSPSYPMGSCSDFVFIWGYLSQSHPQNPQLLHTSGLGCNKSYEVVDVNTSFVSTDLIIDTQRPPTPLKETRRNSSASFGWSTFVGTYGHLLHMISSTNDSLDPFFSLLTTSQWAIPVSMLGDPTKNDIVAEAIRFQDGIIWTQMLNANRNPADMTNATLTDPPPNVQDGNDARSYAATLTDSNVRVVQDTTSTRILEALLLVALSLQILSWVFIPKANVLPNRSPTTIANMVALLAGGNVLELLPADCQSMSTDEIKKSLSRRKFWMGWGNMPDVEGLMSGNENENGVSRFGIFAVDPDEKLPKESRGRKWFRL